MKQFTFPLRKGVERPTMILGDPLYILAMLDTGSLFPVWVDNAAQLREMGGVPVAYDQPFGGFGGMTKGTIYRLPVFRLGDLVYPNFPIIAAPSRLPCQMILSATMFSGLVYEIDDDNHRLNITVPDKRSPVRNLVIKTEGGRAHILCTDGEL